MLSEPATPSFAQAYRVLARMEESGVVRRGYFVTGLGGAQFAMPGAVDRLRQAAPTPMRLLAACDPANPYGAALEWPASKGHRPTRKAGALVVLADGAPVCYLERGARTLVTFDSTNAEDLAQALALMGEAVDRSAIQPISIDRVDGAAALSEGVHTEAMAAAGFVMVPQGYKRRRHG